MKNDSTRSNKPSTSQAGAVPDPQHAREAAKGSQEQQELSHKTSGQHSKDVKQHGGASQSNERQQQAGSGNDNGHGSAQKTSPSRDQGHSPSGSSGNDASSNRSDSNSPGQTGKNN